MSCPTCTHLKTNGIVCGSPALRGKQLCYFHQRDLDRGQHRARVLRQFESRELHLPPLNTPLDVQIALFKVMDALAANAMEPRRAFALLFAIQQASLLFRQPNAA